MELNEDCIRDILLKCEELIQMDDDGSIKRLNIDDLTKKLPKYTKGLIIYHVKLLNDEQLIKATIKYADGRIYYVIINDITPEGYKFLGDIHEDNVWEKIKEKTKKLGTVSIEIIKSVAVSVISEEIGRLFGK